MAGVKELLEVGSRRRTAPVEVPGIGTFYVQSLTERERASIEKASREDTAGTVLARLIQLCAVNDKGHRLFKDGQSELESILDLDVAVAGAFERAIDSLADTSRYEETLGNLEGTTAG